MPRQFKLNTPEKRARVGERIKVAATHAGLTLKELAERADSSPSLIYQYVRGITSISPEVLEKIAAVTRVHTDFFDPDKDARAALALSPDRPAPEGDSLVSLGSEPGTRARMQAELRSLTELAQAQNFPKRDRLSYVATLNQMLGLARALENRQQEGWILWMLGRARIEDNDLEGATEYISTAREIFAAEGMDYWHDATQDLALALTEQGTFDRAQKYLEEALANATTNTRWHALMMMGLSRYVQHHYEDALRYYRRAAEAMESLETELREREAMPLLMSHVADVVRATGHYEAAMMLWSRCLQQATVDRRPDLFLESLIEVARCCRTIGRISEARQRLELAVVLAGFLFEDETRLGIARALLADVMTVIGSLEDAKENARQSLRIANKVRGPRAIILSALALAETSLVGGQWEDALAYAQDALNEAKRTSRTLEVAQAREVRARAFLRQHEECIRTDDGIQARQAIAHALAEADTALEVATRTESVHECVSAHLTRARCYFLMGEDVASEQAAREALTLMESGGVGLTRLLGKDAEELPELLRSEAIDLASLFAGRKLEIPGLAWQAHYIRGTLLARRLGPAAGFDAMRDAAHTLSRVLSGLTASEASTYHGRHPDAVAVFNNLKRFALTDAARQETTALLQSTPWMNPEADASLLPSAG